MMFAKLRRLRHDQRGTAIVEMAIVAPVLATMIIGVIDLSNAYGRKLALEQASQRAIEKVMNTTGDTTVEETIRAEAAEQAGVPDGNVTVTYRLECDGTETAADDCSAGETASKWISVSVTDTYSPMFPVHFSGINGDGTYHIVSTAGIRVQ